MGTEGRLFNIGDRVSWREARQCSYHWYFLDGKIVKVVGPKRQTKNIIWSGWTATCPICMPTNTRCIGNARTALMTKGGMFYSVDLPTQAPDCHSRTSKRWPDTCARMACTRPCVALPSLARRQGFYFLFYCEIVRGLRETGVGDVGVDLGGGDRWVAEHGLDRANVGAIADKSVA